MMQQDEDEIRRRAYSIWEREGRPEGRHESHWEQARREGTIRGTGATGTGGDPQGTGQDAPPPGAPRRIKPGQTPGPNAGSRATRRGRE